MPRVVPSQCGHSVPQLDAQSTQGKGEQLSTSPALPVCSDMRSSFCLHGHNLQANMKLLKRVLLVALVY